jgi:hypothetical protein
MNTAQRIDKKQCAECFDWLTLDSFPPSPHQKDGRLPKCRACIAKPDIHARIARWYDYATRSGIQIKCIAVHPGDVSAAPPDYKGLPIVAIGRRV